MNTVTREQITDINDAAARYFRDQLLAEENTGPRDYLTSRRFEALLEHDTPWTVGFAPGSWTSLRDHLARLGHTEETMLAAGLVSISSRDTVIDRFRNRLTFGIRDHNTQLVGFTARAAPAVPDGTPKYLNTPRTAAFDKSSVLFGLGEATNRPRAVATVITEGPLDAIAVDLAGHGAWAPLALCGGALTPSHAHRIAEIGSRVVLAFDDDHPGHRTLERATTTLTSHTTEPEALSHTLGSDPAELFTRLGPQNLRTSLEKAQPASQVILNHVLRKWGLPEQRFDHTLAGLREAAETLARLGVEDLAHHAKRLSNTLNIEPAEVTRELSEALTSRRPEGPRMTAATDRNPHRSTVKAARSRGIEASPSNSPTSS